jgi:hypothetical protein
MINRRGLLLSALLPAATRPVWAANGAEPAVDVDALSIDLGRDTGGTVHAEAFGVAVSAGSNDFAMLAHPRFQAVARQLDWPLLRLNFSAADLLVGIFPNRASATHRVVPNWAYLDNIINGLPRFFNGRLVICLSKPARWLDLHENADRALYGDMAVQVAKHMAARGLTMPIYWECINEPEYSGVNLDDAAHLTKHAAIQLKAYNPSYKIGGPTVSTNHDVDDLPAHIRSWVKIVGNNCDYFSFHRYSQATPKTPDDEVYAQAIGYGALVKMIRANVPSALPLFMGEYAVDGTPSKLEGRQLTIVGALFNTLVLCSAIAEGNLESAAVWEAYDDVDSYGVVTPDYTATPAALALRLLRRTMPGRIVLSARPAGQTLVCLASRADAGFGVALINYGNKALRLPLTLLDAKVTAVQYEEISAAHPQGTHHTMLLTGLADLILPRLSIVILSAS